LFKESLSQLRLELPMGPDWKSIVYGRCFCFFGQAHVSKFDLFLPYRYFAFFTTAAFTKFTVPVI
jgi:hypothetical protein